MSPKSSELSFGWDTATLWSSPIQHRDTMRAQTSELEAAVMGWKEETEALLRESAGALTGMLLSLQKL